MRDDRGVTLVEVMVAIGLLMLLSGIVAGVVMSANRVTRTTTGAVTTQAQMLDAMNRVSRDVSVAETLQDPTADALAVKTNRDGSCFVTWYVMRAVDGGRELASADVPIDCAQSGAPRPNASSSAWKVLVGGLGAQAAFTYFDANGNPLPSPVDAAAVERVGVRLQATTSGDRARGEDRTLDLETSVAPRSGLSLGPTDGSGPPRAPSPPTIDPVPDTCDESRTLSWTVAGSVPVDGYTVLRDGRTVARITPDGGGAFTAGDVVTHIVRGLTPGRGYTFEVMAHSTTGMVAVSTPTTVRGCVLPPVPTATVTRADGVRGIDDITVTWPAVNGASAYEVYDHTTGNLLARVDAGGALKYVTVDPPGGTTMSYTVRTVGAGGTVSGHSRVVTETVRPDEPVLTSSHRDGDRILTWERPTGADHFVLQRAYTNDAGATAAWATVAEGNLLAYTDTSAIDAPTFTYRLRAANNALPDGRKWTGWNVGEALEPRPPAPPLTGADSNGNRVLRWTKPANAVGYDVQRTYSGQNGAFTTLYTGTALTYTDTATISAQSFEYRVRAQNKTGWSPHSRVVLGARPDAGPVLSGKANDGNNVLTWTAIENATCYRLYRDNVLLREVTTTTHTDTSPGWASTRTYEVTACNKTGESPRSNAVALKQPPGPFTVTYDNWRPAMYGDQYGGRITPRWTAASGANAYEVHRVARGSDAFGGTWRKAYDGAARNDGGLSTSVFPTAVYDYTVRAKAANGLYRDMTTSVQAPPELPRQMKQVSYFGRPAEADMHARFFITAAPLAGHRSSTYVVNSHSDGKAARFTEAEYEWCQCQAVSYKPGVFNVMSVQTRRDNTSGSAVHFADSKLQVFGVKQAENGYNQMRSQYGSTRWTEMPAGTPTSGYYSPWGALWSNWKETGAVGQPAAWVD